MRFRQRRIAGVGLRKALGCLTGALLLTLSVGALAGSASYTYDTLGRLTKATYSDGVKTTTVNYYYDRVGNRTSVVSTSP